MGAIYILRIRHLLLAGVGGHAAVPVGPGAGGCRGARAMGRDSAAARHPEGRSEPPKWPCQAYDPFYTAVDAFTLTV